MVQHVDRLDDPRIADYARVADHAWLRDRGLFVAEGRLIVTRLLGLNPSAIESILVTPAALGALGPDLAPAVSVFVADASVLHTVTGIDFHRGCLALARRPAPVALASLAAARRLLAIEGIGNPDNVGGLFRVAAAFGVDGMLLDPASADPFYRKAIRTSMGSVFTVPYLRLDRWPEGVASFREAGFTIAALTPRRSATALADFAASVHHRLIAMVGSEGSGLSDAALALADHHVRIPISDRVDSLNVVVAAGVALARL